MEEENKTVLSLEHGGVTVKVELPWDADLDQIMYAFVGCLRGVSFGDWVVEHIKDWCEEQLPSNGDPE